MNESWQKFLADYNVIFDPDSGSRFDDADAEIKAASTGDVLADLSHLGLIKAEGEDASSFLLGQLTNDLNQVDDSHSQISAYCTPKGRMLALFRILRRDQQYLLQAPESVVETVLPRLRMYVMRAKVTLEPATELVAIGVSGPRTESAMQDLVGQCPIKINDSVAVAGISVVRLPGPFPRFLLVGETEPVKAIWRQLADAFTAVGMAAWSWLDIMAGQPTVVSATSEAFVPQMANLDVIDGVNFKKGCYPGQEIVARMQYLGKLKQRMYRAHVDTDTPPAAGDSLFAPAFRDQSAGTIVDARHSPDGGFDMLAVIQIRAVDEGKLHLGSVGGPAVTITELPYELPTAKEA